MPLESDILTLEMEIPQPEGFTTFLDSPVVLTLVQ